MTHSQDVTAYLRKRLPRIDITGPPTPLSGGYLNHVWRVPTAADPLVVKYAPPHIASDPSVALDSSRIAFEARSLALFDPRGTLSGIPTAWMRTPYVLDFDARAHVLVMEDVGPHHLLDRWLPATQPDAAQHAGTMLGHFVGALHARTFGDVHLAMLLDNVPVQTVRQDLQYEAVGDLLVGFGVSDGAALGRVAAELGTTLLEPGQCVIMGDLWPRSILVVQEGLRLIDWEFAHFGRPAQDIGHLAAHIWMLHHRARYAEKQAVVAAFWTSFTAAYREALGVHLFMFRATELVEQSSVHFGAEILMRIAHPFKAGYLYDGLPSDDPLIQEAAQTAARAIRNRTTWDVLEALL